MKLSTSRLLIALLCLFGLASGTLQTAQAAEAVVGISKRVYKAVDEAQAFIDAESYRDAMAVLEKILTRRLSDYEEAVSLNMLGYVYYQLNDINKALATYRKILTKKRLPDSMLLSVLLTVSQLNLVNDNYAAAEKYARQLLAGIGDKPPPLAGYIVLAQSLIAQERFKEALQPLKTAIAEQEKAGGKIRENWLALLASVYFSLEDFHAMRDTLYQLVTINPKEQYLVNLAAIHGQLGDTDKQLALIETLKDDKRLHSEQHLINLANLFMVHELPFKAASLLEEEIAAGRITANKRNLELQSQAWYLAGEYDKALAPLERAAETTGDGELWLRLARLYVALYDWPGAEKFARKAVQRENLKKPGDGLILLGTALARQQKFTAAKKVFRRARQYEASEKYARQWLNFVDSEQQRLAALQ